MYKKTLTRNIWNEILRGEELNRCTFTILFIFAGFVGRYGSYGLFKFMVIGSVIVLIIGSILDGIDITNDQREK